MKILPIIFFFLFFLQVKSQQKINFEQLTIEHGLSQTTVTCILQDKLGFMWFGTVDGLNKYDGYNFRIYRSKDDSSSIADNAINCLFEDSNGDIWIGISKTGLQKYNPVKDKFTLYTNIQNQFNSLINNDVKCLAEDYQKNLWIGTKNGLCRFNFKKQEFTQINNSKLVGSTSDISSIVCDKANRVWIATKNGLFCLYPSGEIKSVTIENSNLSNNQVNTVYIDRARTLWIGTDDGLCSIEEIELNNEKNLRNHSHFSSASKMLPNTCIVSILEDYTGCLWIGTQSGGVVRYFKNENKLFHYQNNSLDLKSLSVNHVLTIYEDRSHIIWIGTLLGGINKYNRVAKPFENYRRNPYLKNTLTSNQVRVIYEDLQGYLWIGTKEGGLNRWLRGDNYFEQYQNIPGNPKSLNDNSVRAIQQDNANNLWIGTENGGLSRFDMKTHTFTPITSSPRDSKGKFYPIWKIIKDSDDKIWIAVFGYGLCLFDPKQNTFKCYSNIEGDTTSLSDNQVCTIFQDSKNNIWVGTYDGGLNFFYSSTGKFKRCPQTFTDNSFKDRIYSITENKHGYLWLATRGSLNLFDPKTFTHQRFDYRDYHFPNHVIMAAIDDEQGNLWIPTNNGLVKFNPETKALRTYFETDGLQSNEFMIGGHCKTKTGQIILGGVNGFTVFHPKYILDNPHQPEVVITDFFVKNQRYSLDSSISYKQTIELSFSDNIFSFEFVGIDFGFSENNTYAYKLEGFDKDWVQCEKRRFASYTNLSSGSYVFKVKAANSDGVWNEQGASLKIRVLYPFWKKWWFIIIVIVIVTILIFYIIKIRDTFRDKGQLEILVKQRTEEINLQKEEISTQLEQIAFQKDRLHSAYKNIKILSEIGRKITSSLSVPEIVDTTYNNLISVIEAPFFGIGIYNPEKKRLDFHGTKLLDVSLELFHHPLTDENRLSIVCFKSRRDILIENYEQQHTKSATQNDTPIIGVNIFKSIIYCPLLTGTNIIGIITIQNYEAGKYTNYHTNILKNIANYVAIALENANAYNQIEIQKKGITDSILYAKKIQTAILPPFELVESLLKDYFILYKPRDIVSGDFYWLSKQTRGNVNYVIFAVADCTGHGVPGAFMSMLGVSLLNEIVTKISDLKANEILNLLREDIIRSLHQTGKLGEPQDGMDIALGILNNHEPTIQYAGANNPLIILRKNNKHSSVCELIEIKADKMPISIFLSTKKPFTNHTTEILNGDSIYLFSDGYIDQFGGEFGKKISLKRFKELLTNIQQYPMKIQSEKLEEFLIHWQTAKSNLDEYHQVDDILVMGIKVILHK